MELKDYSEKEIKAAIALKGTTITGLAIIISKTKKISPQYLSQLFKGKDKFTSKITQDAIMAIIGPELDIIKKAVVSN